MEPPPIETITFTFDCTGRERREGYGLITTPTKVGRKPSARVGSRFGRGMTGWLLFVAASVLLFVYLKQAGLGVPPAQQGIVVDDDTEPVPLLIRLSEIAVPAGLALIVFSFFMLQRLVVKQFGRWNRRMQMSITPDGLVQRRPGMTTTTRWDHFRAMEEGRRVVILRSGVRQGIIIPKRLLGGDAELARALVLLRGYTAKTAIPFTGAFPVIQR